MSETKPTNSLNKKQLEKLLQEKENQKRQIEIAYQRILGSIEMIKQLLDGTNK